jgi:DUF3089 family protein
MAPQRSAKRVLPLIVAVLIALACMTDLGVGSTLARASQPTSDLAGTAWLCRPGQADDPCTASLNTTVISSNGSRHIVDYTAAADPPIDCFYLYPNVSLQDSANANLHIDPQETAIAELEASPFSQDCRVYAPMYREDTGLDPSSKRDALITERSVLSAWHDYLLHYNHGRGFVLIGHSEGSYQIAGDLLGAIDQTPAVRRLFVSAIITGANLPVFKNGFGPLKTIGPCQSAVQTGCVVDYNAFSDPPPSDTIFGKQVPSVLDGHAVETVCTNPANLSGGRGTLISMYRIHLPTQHVAGSSSEGVLVGTPPAISTPWVQYDGQYTGQCMMINQANVLLVRSGRHAPTLTAYLGASWGLHVDDPNLAMGNLVELVHSEAASYSKASATPPSN